MQTPHGKGVAFMDVVSNASDIPQEITSDHNAVALFFFDRDVCFVKQAIHELNQAGIATIAEIATRLGDDSGKIASGPWDLIVTDFELENGGTAFDVLAQVRALGRDVPVIMLTAELSS